MFFEEGRYTLKNTILVDNCHNFTITGNGSIGCSNDGLPQPTSIIYCDGNNMSRCMKMVSTSAVCVLIMSFACIFPQGVYKKWPINVLEIFFLYITSTALGFQSIPNKVVCYSVLSVMIISCGILLYHIHQQIKNTRGWKALVKSFSAYAQKFRKKRHSSLIKDEHALLLPQPLPEVIECPEPILVDL